MESILGERLGVLLIQVTEAFAVHIWNDGVGGQQSLLERLIILTVFNWHLSEDFQCYASEMGLKDGCIFLLREGV